jgi:hypothetical protein
MVANESKIRVPLFPLNLCFSASAVFFYYSRRQIRWRSERRAFFIASRYFSLDFPSLILGGFAKDILLAPQI